MAPKVLYLHGLRGGANGKVKKQLDQILGPDNVDCPDLRTSKSLYISLCLCGLVAAGLISGIVLSFLRLPLWGGFTMGAILLIGGMTAEYLLFRGVFSMILSRGVRVATDAYDRKQPNVIIASGFGAVIARRIPRPKTPLLLLAPALEKYAKWCGDKTHRRLDGYPFVLIVHGSKNRAINVNDSFRTIERADPGRSRLEVVELSAAHPKINDAEMKSFVDETFHSGKAAVQSMRQGAQGEQIITLADFGAEP